MQIRNISFADFKIIFYCAFFIHHLIISLVLINIDFSVFEDPQLRFYHNGRWKLITVWANSILLVYLPLSIYCEIELKKRPSANSKIIDFRSLISASLLLPSNLMADTYFWRMWHKDKTIMLPPNIDEIIPLTAQHCLHTIPIIIVIFDLIFTSRKRTHSKTNVLVLLSFVSLYILINIPGIINGDYIYPCMKKFSVIDFIFLAILVFLEHLFFYYLQFCVLELPVLLA